MVFLAGEKITTARLADEIPNLEDDAGNIATSSNGTTSATYINITGDPSDTFVAPASGRVRVLWGGQCVPGASTATLMSCQIRAGGTIGAGTIISDSSDDRSAVWNATQGSGGYVLKLSGLTGGATYNARCHYRRAAGAASPTWERRYLHIWSSV